MTNIDSLLQQYNNFKDAQIRSVETLSDSSKLLTLVIQDDDGEDIDKVQIEFNGITASKILEAGVLPYLDMMSGITLIKEHDLYGFGLGHGTAMLHVHNAPLFIVASDIKILTT